MHYLPIEKIHPRPDARLIDPATVAGLSESIADVGLINPIRVRVSGDGWEVITGIHRLAACRGLGLVEIAADVVADDDLHAELAMIDENLCRAELSPADRARQTARRKVIYQELHPETRAGGNRKGDTPTETTASFAAHTAKATGRSEGSVYLDTSRGEKVIGEVLDLIKGTGLDKGSYLDTLKAMPPNEQLAAAKRDLLHWRSQQREKMASVRKNKVQSDVKARAAKEVAEIIAEHVPGEWWDAVKSNLYAAGAANIAHELTNITGQSIMDRVAS